MDKYIDGPLQARTMLHMLQVEVETGSKSLYHDAIEAIVHF